LIGFLRPGDLLVISAGMTFTLWLGSAAWFQPAADRVRVRAGGETLFEGRLNQDRRLSVPGPLGTTEIEIRQGRARISRDPSPRQYCVKQGWLSQGGQTALCLPNRVSLEVLGVRSSYDSLNY
jgi:hypothetical protein